MARRVRKRHPPKGNTRGGRQSPKEEAEPKASKPVDQNNQAGRGPVAKGGLRGFAGIPMKADTMQRNRPGWKDAYGQRGVW